MMELTEWFIVSNLVASILRDRLMGHMREKDMVMTPPNITVYAKKALLGQLVITHTNAINLSQNESRKSRYFLKDFYENMCIPYGDAFKDVITRIPFKDGKGELNDE